MSGTSSIRRRATLFLSALALVGVAGLAGSQVPTKPPPKDTTVKQQGKAKTPATKPAPRTEQKHIKIQKEVTSGGEVVPPVEPCPPVPPAVDEQAVRAEQYRLDSTAAALERDRLMRDNEARIAKMNEDARLKAIADEEAAQLALKKHLARGYYFGLGGGASSPQRDIRDGYTGGYNITVPVGFDATDNPFGIRADFGVDHLNGTRLHNQSAQVTAMSGDITVWSLNADLKARMMAPGSTRTHLYLIGGVGAHRVTGGIYGTTGPNAGTNKDFNDAGTKFGWNLGGGLQFSWGPADLFVESRYFQVNTNYTYNAAGGVGKYTTFTPIIVGMQWF